MSWHTSNLFSWLLICLTSHVKVVQCEIMFAVRNKNKKNILHCVIKVLFNGLQMVVWFTALCEQLANAGRGIIHKCDCGCRSCLAPCYCEDFPRYCWNHDFPRYCWNHGKAGFLRNSNSHPMKHSRITFTTENVRAFHFYLLLSLPTWKPMTI